MKKDQIHDKLFEDSKKHGVIYLLGILRSVDESWLMFEYI